MNGCMAVYLFVIANLLLLSSVQAKATMKKYLWLQELQPCSDEPGMAHLNGSFKYTGRGAFYVNMQAEAPWQIDNLYAYVDMKKCPTKQFSADCENMMKFPAGDQCKKESAFFGYLYDKFEPPIICPLSGSYRAKDVVFDPENHSIFFRGLAEEEWLLTNINVYADEKRTKKVICLVMIATMKRIRVQDKTNIIKTRKN